MAKNNDLLLDDLNEQNFPAMLKWLYRDSPANVTLEFMAKQGDEVIAHYGALPFAFKLAGAAGLIGGFASNLVIDKANRTGSLFFSLQSYFFREYPKKGFAFMYGLITRDGVLEPHLRMGWKKQGEVPVYARPVNLANVARAALTQPWLAEAASLPLKLAAPLWNAGILWGTRGRLIKVERVDRFDDSIEPVLAKVAQRFPTIALRSPAILNWRFTGLSTREYQLFVARRSGQAVGYFVTRRLKMKGLDALALVDFAFDPDDIGAGRAVLRSCTQEAAKQKVDLVATILNPGSPFLPFLKRVGFLKTPETFKMVTHVPKTSAVKIDSSVFEQWHLTWFDHDYV